MKEKKQNIKILITGSRGFIGTHLIHSLEKLNYECFQIDRDYDDDILRQYCLKCDFIIHLAGVMRPNDASEFYVVGSDLTDKILTYLKQNKRKPSIIFSSSTQAVLDNDYGKSKAEIENKLIAFSKEYGNKVFIFRLSNIFGKWGRPNYNSVAATFCNNIANDLPIKINDPNTIVNFIYIDDVVASFINVIFGKLSHKKDDFYYVTPIYPTSLNYLANKLYSFKKCILEKQDFDILCEFDMKLFCVFTSFFDYTSLISKGIFPDKCICNKYVSKEKISNFPFIRVFLKSSVMFVCVKSGMIRCKITNLKNQFDVCLCVEKESTLFIPCGSFFEITGKDPNTECFAIYINKYGIENIK